MAALQPDFISPAFADRAFIRKNIEETESDILIAEENGNTEGFLLIQEKKTPPYDCFIPHRYAYIMDICVDECSRERVSVQCYSSRPEHGPRKEIWNI